MGTSDIFRGLLACWQDLSVAAGGKVPARRQLNPMAIPKLLPFVYLVERRSRYELIIRLSGTALDDATSRPVTGQNLMDRYPREEWDFHANAFEAMANQPCAARVDRLMELPPDPCQEISALTVPLADDHGAVRYALGVANVRRFYGVPTKAELADVRLHYIDLGFGVPKSR